MIISPSTHLKLLIVVPWSRQEQESAAQVADETTESQSDWGTSAGRQ